MSRYDIAPAADVETAVMAMLRRDFPLLATPAGGQLRVGGELPADLTTRVTSTVPYVRVAEIGGSSTPYHDRVTIDLDVFSKSRALSRKVAFDLQSWLMGRPDPIVVDGKKVIIEIGDKERVTSIRPQEVPWDDTTLRRYYSSYSISARR